MTKLIRLAAIVAALAVPGGAASAHPHVWVTSQSEIVYAPDGTVTAVRHAWTFDDMFTAYAMQGLPQKTKGQFTREELADLAKTNAESLKEYRLLHPCEGGADKQRFADPVDYYLEYKDNVLTLHFTLPFRAPVKAKALTIEVFDPQYFIDCRLPRRNRRSSTAPPPAARSPRSAQPEQSRRAEAHRADVPERRRRQYGAAFANKLSVTCP